MDRASGRISAWQRLGLTLAKDQSRPNSHDDGLHIARYQHEGSQAAKNYTPKPGGDVSRPDGENLGKRKHPAEHHGQTSKKPKRTKQHNNLPGISAQTAPAITNLGNGSSEAKPAATAGPETPSKKGDPNYRKKGDPNYRKKKDRKPSRQERPRTPSLSPGQLDLASDGATLLVSTETDFHPAPDTEANKVTNPPARKAKSSSLSQSPGVGRRKSVAFTPDTKTVDGSSASNLFKKWVQDQKDSGAELSQSDIALLTPPKSHPANHNPSPSVATRKGAKTVETSESKNSQSASNSQHTTTSSAKKKDTSRYTSYLEQYYNDRPNWKFNKAKQNDVLENALNIFRIPDTFSGALFAYIQGLQGAGVIDRLKQRCQSAIEEIDAELNSMDDVELRKAAQEEAMRERLSKERKRRRLEGDIENMLDHPYTEGYIRRLKKSRAEALLAALNLAAPAPAPAKRLTNSLSKKFSPETAAPEPPPRDSRKRKRRTDVSSDESSDSSSSEDSSSSSDDDSASESSVADTTSESISDSESDSESSTSSENNGEEQPSGASNKTSSSDSESGSDSEEPSGSGSDSDSD